MSLLAIKCYLPGRRTQYVLEPVEDVSVELGAGADLCPRGFDEATRVRFNLVGEDWFVATRAGQVRHEDGRLVDEATAVELPMTLIAGSATLVLTSLVDPRFPSRASRGSAGPASKGASSEPRPHVAAHTSSRAHATLAGRELARRASPATAALRCVEPQPHAATLQPQVAAGNAALTRDAAPFLDIGDPRGASREAGRSNETRILDMSKFGAPSAEASSEAAPKSQLTGPRRLWAGLSPSRRLLAYGMLGVALVALQFRIRRQASASAAEPALPTQVPATAAGATGVEVKASALRSEELHPGEVASQQRAGELYALGDYASALRQYRALAAEPEAEPVFGVIAHALEQRLRRPPVKQ